MPRHALTMGMGGTLHRLVDQGHEVTVVYLTAGDLAVPDGDALRISRIIAGLHNGQEGGRETGKLITRVHEELQNKGAFDLDSADLRHLKSLIRREEACAASHQCGVDPESLVFLDLPFYQAGRYRSFAPGEIDVAALVELYSFYRQCHPGGPGWAKVLLNAREEGVDLNGAESIDWQMPLKLLCVFIVAEGLPLPHLSH